MASSLEVDRLLTTIETTVGSRGTWHRWPGGWPGDIEAALVDAIYSARAVYRTTRGHGVHEQVCAWMDCRRRAVFSTRSLLAELEERGPDEWARQFGNRQVAPGRPKHAHGGPLKSAAIREAAAQLVADGVNFAGDINDRNVEDVKKRLRSVPGVGHATVNYFLMLLGRPGVKPDRMIHRFLSRALGRRLTNGEAELVLSQAAERLGVQPHELDHAIWSWERSGAHAA